MENNLNLNSENIELNKVLNESAETINSEVAQKIKKKRGRPAGAKTGDKKDSKNSQGEAPAVMIRYSKDQYKNALSGVFVISGMYLSKATGFDGFNMQAEEIEALASQGSEVCDQFMPAIDSKYVALGGFVLGCASVYGLKYMAFKEWKMSQSKKPIVKKEENKEK